MSRLLFENSKAALGFAGVIIFGAVVFAGSSDVVGGDDRAETSEVAQTVANPQKVAQKPSPRAAQQSAPVFGDFAPDEDLIDDASGIDPVPEMGGEIVSEPSSGGGSSSGARRAPQIPATKAQFGAPAIPDKAQTSNGDALEVR